MTTILPVILPSLKRTIEFVQTSFGVAWNALSTRTYGGAINTTKESAQLFSPQEIFVLLLQQITRFNV